MNFYRYELRTYNTSTFGYLFSDTKLVCNEYNLHKETPKGYWIGYGDLTTLHSNSRWVSKTSVKRYAYPTKEEALSNYLKRSDQRERILENQLSACKKGIQLALKELNNLENNEKVFKQEKV